MTEKLRRLVVDHPMALGVFLSVIAGYSVLNAYRTGLVIGQIRALQDDAARLASEALGG